MNTPPVTSPASGLVMDLGDTAARMQMNGLEYGGAGDVRFATGRRDGAAPAFPRVIPDGTVGMRRRMINRD